MARANDLGTRLRALRSAAEEGRGPIDDEVVDGALKVVQRAGHRLEASGDATVVALGGATGSGKSSTFNALSGTEFADPGIRRPTTSRAMAVTFGSQAADDLLNWLEIPTRHSLEPGAKQSLGLDGLVLIDLPDHDSTEVAHRQEVDRLVELVDMLIWVVDPQKYADAALHDRYLKPYAEYADVMMVVLNQIDKLQPAERDRCMKDLRRLLDSEGLQKTEIHAISAYTGEGVDALRDKLRRRVADKKTAATRLGKDVGNAAELLHQQTGDAAVTRVEKSTVQRLNRALGEAAGVPVVADAVGDAWRYRGALATGWPVLAWVKRFKPDPLRRLHLDRLGAGKKGKEIDPARVSRTALPSATSVQQARVDSAVRDLADEVSEGLPKGWAQAVRAASKQNDTAMTDRLDRAIATTDLGVDRNHGWWTFITILQWILVAVVVAGLAWLGSAFVMLYLQLPPLPDVYWWGVPAPTILLGGGVLAGLLVALFARIGVEVGARSKQRQARNELLNSIARVTQDNVIAPVNAELDRYESVRDNVKIARQK